VSAPSAPARRESWFEQNPKKTFLVLGLAFLLFAELVCQGAYYVQHKHAIFNQAFEVTNIVRTGDERAYTLRPNHKTYRYQINAQGYRGKPIEGEPDMLMLGDSVPFGSGVHDTKTYPYHLSREYGLKVINGGVPSYTYWQSLARWKKDFGHLNPKIVTFQATNDLPLVTHFQDKWYPKITWLDYRWPRQATLKKHALRKSALFHYVATAFDRNQSADFDEKHHPLTGEIRKNFFAHISTSIDEIAAHGVQKDAAVILVASNPFWYTDKLEKNAALQWTKDVAAGFKTGFEPYQAINSLLKHKAEQYDNVYFFDIQTLMNRMNRAELFHDPIHHNDHGNRVFARLLYEFMQKHGLLEGGE
jgi:hypothetical protein